MPELPEVETIVRNLRKKLPGLQIVEVRVLLKKCIQGSWAKFQKALRGKRIISVERRGKNIILHLQKKEAIIIHLRMTGSLRFLPAESPLDKHTHVLFSFRDYPWQLRFIDQRQFGRLHLEPKGEGGELRSLKKLGPEPLQINKKKFLEMMKGKRCSIKALLLDQTFLAGIGNIYADELLHRVGIHPRQRAEILNHKKIEELLINLQALLREAIRWRGTSVRTYVDAEGSTGAFQRLLLVYGREGEECQRCGTIIVREKIAGRSTYFCPRCQPLI